jgi:ribosome maturation factor RimP
MQLDVRKIEKRAEELVAPVLSELGYSLVACEFLQDGGRWVLRIYIERDEGITVGDCASASHAVEDLIAVEDFIPAAYNLEVSSPGINRPLRGRSDFKRFAGEHVKIKTQRPLGGRSNFKGIICGVKGEDVELVIDNQRFLVPISEISRARLDPVEISMKKQ